jgi:hypothetical protein
MSTIDCRSSGRYSLYRPTPTHSNNLVFNNLNRCYEDTLNLRNDDFEKALPVLTGVVLSMITMVFLTAFSPTWA